MSTTVDMEGDQPLPLYGDSPFQQWFVDDEEVARVATVQLPPQPKEGAKPWRAWCKTRTAASVWVDFDTVEEAEAEVRRLMDKYGHDPDTCI